VRALIHVMGSKLAAPARIAVCSLIVLVALLTLTAAAATGARHSRNDASCAWGASSMRAEIVDGRVVTTTPVVTGCTPH